MYLYCCIRMYITLVLLHFNSCLYCCLLHIYVGISDLRIYVSNVFVPTRSGHYRVVSEPKLSLLQYVQMAN